MKKFNLSGEFKLGEQWKTFSKDIPANDENHAKDLLMARFGSKHKLPRRFINIVSVSESKESIVLQEPKTNDKESSK